MYKCALTREDQGERVTIPYIGFIPKVILINELFLDIVLRSSANLGDAHGLKVYLQDANSANK